MTGERPTSPAGAAPGGLAASNAGRGTGQGRRPGPAEAIPVRTAGILERVVDGVQGVATGGVGRRVRVGVARARRARVRLDLFPQPGNGRRVCPTFGRLLGGRQRPPAYLILLPQAVLDSASASNGEQPELAKAQRAGA